jgi:hypothetical protein
VSGTPGVYDAIRHCRARSIVLGCVLSFALPIAHTYDASLAGLTGRVLRGIFCRRPSSTRSHWRGASKTRSLSSAASRTKATPSRHCSWYAPLSPVCGIASSCSAR